MSESRKKLRIHGRVQGVFYRAWCVEAARSRGLAGWVRNRRDGTVEMLLVGDRNEISAMIEACHRGPPAARVEKIDVEEPQEDRPAGFETRPTA